MDKLNAARCEIDRVDNEMAALFVRRMQATGEIAAYKKENHLPIEDKKRENAMIGRLSADVPAEYRPYYIRFLTSLIDESKRYQAFLTEKEV